MAQVPFNSAPIRRIFAVLRSPAAVTTGPDVAEAVWCAAGDPAATLRYPAGADAIALARNADASRQSGM